MTQAPTQQRSAPLISALDSLLAAVSAFKNYRAIALLGLTFLAVILIGVIFGVLANAAGSSIFRMLGALISFVVGFYGVSAVGILLMQEAQGGSSQRIMDAVLLSLFSSHRLIAVALLQSLIVLAVFAVIAVIFFICKIPVLGPVLFAFAFPAAALVIGMVVFSLFYIIFPLAGPAVWSGSTTFQVIARLNTIARNKLIPVIMQQFMLFLIVMFVSAIIFGVVMLGFTMATALSSQIIGAGSAGMGMFGMSGIGGMGGVRHMGGMGSMFSGMGDGGGHIMAAMIGGSLLFAVAAIIPALIATKGLCIIYLNVTHGLDFAQAETQLESGMATVKKKAEEARERARQMAEQAKNSQKASDAPTSPAAPTATAETVAPTAVATAPITTHAVPTSHAAPSCPSCHATIGADDVFCGDCGHKLK